MPLTADIEEQLTAGSVAHGNSLQEGANAPLRQQARA